MSAYPSIDTDVLRTFVAIADQGGFTRAGEMVNRTQSAVSMQMKRLEEDVLQRQLFERDGRQVRLTAEGQVLLGYAAHPQAAQRSVQHLARAAHGRHRAHRHAGRLRDAVSAGDPVAVCAVLSADPDRSALRVQQTAVAAHRPRPVHRHPRAGQRDRPVLRKERLVWAEAQNSAHEQTPLPLAMFNSDCFCRLWACNALDAMGRDYRIAYNSTSLSAMMAVVSAGLAITAQLESLITQTCASSEPEDLPLLPEASIMLIRNLNNPSPITECLAEHIVEGFKL
jgi:DNA-binding transcriptional LysR family regulator